MIRRPPISTRTDTHRTYTSLFRSPALAKARSAYVPDNCLIFPTLTGRELLEKIAAEKNAAVDDTVLDLAVRLGLQPHLDKRFEQMRSEEHTSELQSLMRISYAGFC